jgi:microcompartment protein CcmK/EutM
MGGAGSFGFRISDFLRVSTFGFRNSRMLLARVEGNVVATRKHPSLVGWRLVICQPINQAGQPEGVPQIAIDAHGAGLHQRVVISSDGSAARSAVGDEKSPVRYMVIGVVDDL